MLVDTCLAITLQPQQGIRAYRTQSIREFQQQADEVD